MFTRRNSPPTHLADDELEVEAPPTLIEELERALRTLKVLLPDAQISANQRQCAENVARVAHDWLFVAYHHEPFQGEDNAADTEHEARAILMLLYSHTIKASQMHLVSVAMTDRQRKLHRLLRR